VADRIERRARFDLIRYANVWEDAEVLCAALRPEPGKRILSIASGGDNSFSLLAGGAEVVAVDLSAAQLSLVELKRAALRRLGDDALLAFLGVRPAAAEERQRLFHRLEKDLSDRARTFWWERPSAIGEGVIHHGKFESYFRLFRTRVLPLVHGRKTVQRLLEPRDAAARRTFYDETWDTWRWRLLFRVFFSRFTMGRLGRDPEFFRYVEGSVAENILGRTKYALTELPVHSNPYIDYILTGNYTHTLPHWLRPEVVPKIRESLGRLSLLEGSAEQIAAAVAERAGFDGFNLSDIFEYMDAATSEAVYGRLLATARPGARFAYWNMLAPRRLAPAFPGRVLSLDDEAKELFARDLAFFYSAFVIDEVVA
jgi:S-adenosylmethionine-diacylglycerol 3-amino-3-carboxypropyl transferase